MAISQSSFEMLKNVRDKPKTYTRKIAEEYDISEGAAHIIECARFPLIQTQTETTDMFIATDFTERVSEHG